MGIWTKIKLAGGLWAAGAALALVLSGTCLAAEAEKPADKPAAPEVKPEQVSGGLQLVLVMKERTFRAPGGGDNAAERKVKVPTLQLKNVGDKPIVLDFQLPGAGGFGGRGGAAGPTGIEAGPVRVIVKEANADDAAKAEDRPVLITVLKPGQVLEQSLIGAARFPADGKYKLQVEIEVAAKDALMPGVKPWSGKLKSNELEYDYQGGFGGNFGGGGGGGGRGGPGGGGGGRGNRGGGQAPAPVPGEPDNAF